MSSISTTIGARWKGQVYAQAHTFDMFEHYTDMVAAIDAVLHFSSSL